MPQSNNPRSTPDHSKTHVRGFIAKPIFPADQHQLLPVFFESMYATPLYIDNTPANRVALTRAYRDNLTVRLEAPHRAQETTVAPPCLTTKDPASSTAVATTRTPNPQHTYTPTLLSSTTQLKPFTPGELVVIDAGEPLQVGEAVLTVGGSSSKAPVVTPPLRHDAIPQPRRNELSLAPLEAQHLGRSNNSLAKPPASTLISSARATPEVAAVARSERGIYPRTVRIPGWVQSVQHDDTTGHLQVALRQTGGADNRPHRCTVAVTDGIETFLQNAMQHMQMVTVTQTQETRDAPAIYAVDQTRPVFEARFQKYEVAKQLSSAQQYMRVHLSTSSSLGIVRVPENPENLQIIKPDDKLIPVGTTVFLQQVDVNPSMRTLPEADRFTFQLLAAAPSGPPVFELPKGLLLEKLKLQPGQPCYQQKPRTAATDNQKSTHALQNAR